MNPVDLNFSRLSSAAYGENILPLEGIMRTASGDIEGEGVNKPDTGEGNKETDRWLAIFTQALAGLSPVLTTEQEAFGAYVAAIDRIWEGLVDPETGEPVSKLLADKIALLEVAMEQMPAESPQRDGLSALLVSCMNLRFELTKWMQEIISADGKSEEEQEEEIGW